MLAIVTGMGVWNNNFMRVKRSLFKRPKWSLKSSFLTALGLIAVITPLVMLTVKKSIWVELEIVTGILTVLMFVYMSVILHQGVRFDKKERFAIDWHKGQKPTISDAFDITSRLSPVDLDFPFTQAGAEEGIVGAIIGVILDVVISFLLIAIICFVVWFGANFLLEGIFIVTLPLFYFHRRSLRYLVAKGRACKGNWAKSLIHAFTSSVLYTAWFYLIVYTANHISRAMGK